MFLAYYDESGDDGFPEYSSALFILTATYFHFSEWKNNYEKIYLFRKKLKEEFQIPVKVEMHSKKFILNKNPYKDFNLSDESRIRIVELFCALIADLKVKIINVAINKKKITTVKYNVLDTAFTYSIQRIENDLVQQGTDKRFMIITDPGREAKMRDTSRKIQKINFIPSKYTDVTYRNEIKLLIEDPLPKESKESFFIQISDFVSYLVHLYLLKELKIGDYSNRIPEMITHERVCAWMQLLKSSLNLKASGGNEYGIVYYPK
jgi:hypothetical protein